MKISATTWKAVGSVVLLLLMPLGYYWGVYDAFGYNSEKSLYGILLLVFAPVGIHLLWWKWKKYLSTLLMGIIGLGLMVFTIEQKNNYRVQELASYGTEAMAKVIGFDEVRYRRSSTPVAILAYEYEGKTYFQNVNNEQHTYQLGQKARLKISVRRPEIFEIIVAKDEK